MSQSNKISADLFAFEAVWAHGSTSVSLPGDSFSEFGVDAAFYLDTVFFPVRIIQISGFEVSVGSNGSILVNQNTTSCSSPSQAIRFKKWVFLSIQVSATMVDIFVDGFSVFQTPLNAPVVTSHSMMVLLCDYFFGYLHSAHMFSRVASREKVLSRMYNPSTAKAADDIIFSLCCSPSVDGVVVLQDVAFRKCVITCENVQPIVSRIPLYHLNSRPIVSPNKLLNPGGFASGKFSFVAAVWLGNGPSKSIRTIFHNRNVENEPCCTAQFVETQTSPKKCILKIGTDSKMISFSYVFDENVWYYIAVSFSKTSAKLYVNGSLMQSTSGINVDRSGMDGYTKIGCAWNNTTDSWENYLFGSMYYFGVFDSELELSSIQHIYANGLHSSEKGLVSMIMFDGDNLVDLVSGDIMNNIDAIRIELQDCLILTPKKRFPSVTDELLENDDMRKASMLAIVMEEYLKTTFNVSICPRIRNCYLLRAGIALLNKFGDMPSINHVASLLQSKNFDKNDIMFVLTHFNYECSAFFLYSMEFYEGSSNSASGTRDGMIMNTMNNILRYSGSMFFSTPALCDQFVDACSNAICRRRGMFEPGISKHVNQCMKIDSRSNPQSYVRINLPVHKFQHSPNDYSIEIMFSPSTPSFDILAHNNWKIFFENGLFKFKLNGTVSEAFIPAFAPVDVKEYNYLMVTSCSSQFIVYLNSHCLFAVVDEAGGFHGVALDASKVMSIGSSFEGYISFIRIHNSEIAPDEAPEYNFCPTYNPLTMPNTVMSLSVKEYQLVDDINTQYIPPFSVDLVDTIRGYKPYHKDEYEVCQAITESYSNFGAFSTKEFSVYIKAFVTSTTSDMIQVLFSNGLYNEADRIMMYLVRVNLDSFRVVVELGASTFLGDTILLSGGWMDFLLTYKDREVNMYVMGIYYSGGFLSSVFKRTNSASITVGEARDGNQANNPLNGFITHLVVFDKAVSNEDALFFNQNEPFIFEDGVVSLYNFMGSSVTEIVHYRKGLMESCTLSWLENSNPKSIRYSEYTYRVNRTKLSVDVEKNKIARQLVMKGCMYLYVTAATFVEYDIVELQLKYYGDVICDRYQSAKPDPKDYNIIVGLGIATLVVVLVAVGSCMMKRGYTRILAVEPAKIFEMVTPFGTDGTTPVDPSGMDANAARNEGIRHRNQASGSGGGDILKVAGAMGTGAAVDTGSKSYVIAVGIAVGVAIVGVGIYFATREPSDGPDKKSGLSAEPRNIKLKSDDLCVGMTKNGKGLEKDKLWDCSEESAVLVRRDLLPSSKLTVTFAIYVEKRVTIANFCSDVSSLEYNVIDCVFSSYPDMDDQKLNMLMSYNDPTPEDYELICGLAFVHHSSRNLFPTLSALQTLPPSIYMYLEKNLSQIHWFVRDNRKKRNLVFVADYINKTTRVHEIGAFGATKGCSLHSNPLMEGSSSVEDVFPDCLDDNGFKGALDVMKRIEDERVDINLFSHVLANKDSFFDTVNGFFPIDFAIKRIKGIYQMLCVDSYLESGDTYEGVAISVEILKDTSDRFFVDGRLVINGSYGWNYLDVPCNYRYKPNAVGAVVSYPPDYTVFITADDGESHVEITKNIDIHLFSVPMKPAHPIKDKVPFEILEVVGVKPGSEYPSGILEVLTHFSKRLYSSDSGVVFNPHYITPTACFNNFGLLYKHPFDTMMKGLKSGGVSSFVVSFLLVYGVHLVGLSGPVLYVITPVCHYENIQSIWLNTGLELCEVNHHVVVRNGDLLYDAVSGVNGLHFWSEGNHSLNSSGDIGSYRERAFVNSLAEPNTEYVFSLEDVYIVCVPNNQWPHA